MFNFLHNIVIGISAAILAFTGAFHGPVPEIQSVKTPPVQTTNASSGNTKGTQIIPPVDMNSKTDSPVYKQQSGEALKAEAQTEADRVARINALKAQQAVDNKLEAQREAQAHADGVAQDKQDLLDAINLKIANLNSQYAKDTAAVYNESGLYGIAINQKIQTITDKYKVEYNLLTAEFQQIQYSK